MRPVRLIQFPDDDNATTSADTDECPNCSPTERLYLTRRGQRLIAQRARWELTLGSIRAHLDEQPTPSARRAAARRWCHAITRLADQTAGDRR